jgi:hypothetical protein
MAVLEALLALIGLVALIGAVAYCYSLRSADPPPVETDLAAPYREGLHTAIRLQTAAQDLEQQMYVEAVRRADEGSGG